ncbi:MAG: VWA domain-containing protein [Sandaracinaceae bacterium]
MRHTLSGLLALLLMAMAAPAPAAAQSWVGGSPLHTQVRVGADGETYVGVWIEAPNVSPVRSRAPMAVSLVVDTSGSMAGAKIRNAQMAAASLVESLAPGDIVSIYAFSNQVTQIAAPTVIGPGTRASLMQGIRQLYAGGGTNLWDGMQVGIARMNEAPATHPLRRVFLISDGRANVGPADPQSLGDLAARATEFGTQVTAIGVGYDYDQQTLSAMAVRSSGRLYHLAEPQQMAAILEGELDLLSRSVAVNAYLEVVPAPGVTILSGETTGTVISDGRLRLPLGSMHAGQRREVLFRARIPSSQLGQHSLAQARVVYRTPSEGEERVSEAPIAYEVARSSAPPAPRVASMVANHEASVAQLRAAEAMRQGQQQRAVQELQRARQQLSAAAAVAPPSPQRRQLRERATRMQAAQDSAAGASSAPAQAAAAYEFADEAIEAEGY